MDETLNEIQSKTCPCDCPKNNDSKFNQKPVHVIEVDITK